MQFMLSLTRFCRKVHSHLMSADQLSEFPRERKINALLIPSYDWFNFTTPVLLVVICLLYFHINVIILILIRHEQRHVTTEKPQKSINSQYS